MQRYLSVVLCAFLICPNNSFANIDRPDREPFPFPNPLPNPPTPEQQCIDAANESNNQCLLSIPDCSAYPEDEQGDCYGQADHDISMCDAQYGEDLAECTPPEPVPDPCVDNPDECGGAAPDPCADDPAACEPVTDPCVEDPVACQPVPDPCVDDPDNC